MSDLNDYKFNGTQTPPPTEQQRPIENEQSSPAETAAPGQNEQQTPVTPPQAETQPEQTQPEPQPTQPEQPQQPQPQQTPPPAGQTPPPPPPPPGYNPYITYQAWKEMQGIEPKKKKKRKWPFVLLGIFVFFVLIAAIGASNAGTDDYGAALPAYEEDYIAVLYIDSEIAGDYVTTSMYGASGMYNQVFLLDMLSLLCDDVYNRGIMLYINSPGGEVTATDEFTRALTYYKEQTGRPVYAYFADTAASGAYWIGTFADKIIASKFCTTGSIGVTYGAHIEISGMLEKLGITVTELTSGDNKGMGSMYSPLTDEQKAIYQRQLAEIHELFIDTVASNRSLDRAKVEKLADGRTFTASEALSHGLLDGIGYYEDAKAAMIADCGLSDSIIFHDCIDESYYQNSLMYYLESSVKDPEAIENDYAAALALIDRLANNKKFMVKYYG